MSELIPNIFLELASLTVVILAFAITAVPPGDVILLIKGGRDFEVLEGLEMIEVKQGPKTCFDGTIRSAQLG